MPANPPKQSAGHDRTPSSPTSTSSGFLPRLSKRFRRPSIPHRSSSARLKQATAEHQQQAPQIPIPELPHFSDFSGGEAESPGAEKSLSAAAVAVDASSAPLHGFSKHGSPKVPNYPTESEEPRVPRQQSPQHATTTNINPKPGALPLKMSDADSSEDDIFVNVLPQQRQRVRQQHKEAPANYDLNPPPPTAPLQNIEHIAQRLFSQDHLNFILRDHAQHSRFSSFLAQYRPNYLTSLAKYVDLQKAIAAVNYANALAIQILPGSNAAALNPDFPTATNEIIEELCDDALPGYITYRMTQIVSEVLVKEITGSNTPLMRDAVRGLAEVYCLTDPSIPDNPIVYASEEFYRCTQYGRDYVIGRNCRFLQGPKSSAASIQRLIDALAEGQEICETILNYRRDGSPFVNLLLIAPLYDNRGQVRYFIGAQVDINGLVEQGRGLESLRKLLDADSQATRYGLPLKRYLESAKNSRDALSDLAQLWSPNEHDRIRTAAEERADPTFRSNDRSGRPVDHGRRRYLGIEDPSDTYLYPPPELGPSGRLPGIFQNYLLVRPYPSLRITFTSPALRIPGLLQSKFIDRVSASPHIKDGIVSALASGVGVTAKIDWLVSPEEIGSKARPMASHVSESGSSRAGSRTAGHVAQPGELQSPLEAGMIPQPRWIHATPLLSSEDSVGVWMIVMIDSEQPNITFGKLSAKQTTLGTVSEAASSPVHSGQHSRSGSQRQPKEKASRREKTFGVSDGFSAPGVNRPVTVNSDAQKLYQEYLRREGRGDEISAQLPPNSSRSRNPSSSARKHGAGPGSGGSGGTAGTGGATSSRTARGLAVRDHPDAQQRERENAYDSSTMREKMRRAKALSDRALAGEDTFRDF